MEKLPAQLAERLTSIFSQKEISDLKTIFSLKNRPVSFRLNTLSTTYQEVEEILDKTDLKYSKLDFPKNSYLLDKSFIESDVWRH